MCPICLILVEIVLFLGIIPKLRLLKKISVMMMIDDVWMKSLHFLSFILILPGMYIYLTGHYMQILIAPKLSLIQKMHQNR